LDFSLLFNVSAWWPHQALVPFAPFHCIQSLNVPYLISGSPLWPYPQHQTRLKRSTNDKNSAHYEFTGIKSFITLIPVCLWSFAQWMPACLVQVFPQLSPTFWWLKWLKELYLVFKDFPRTFCRFLSLIQ
jgi:hypothetical protein